MNPLVERQIKKYFPQEFLDNATFIDFLKSVSRSYDNYEEQFKMTQRAMKISSEELSDVNSQLRQETKQQKELVLNLQKTLATLKIINQKDNDPIGNVEIDSKKLVEVINSQANELVDVNRKQEKLFRELEQQNQELNDYAHIVSHDLKSPLRSIDALVNWLREDYSDAFDNVGKENLKLIEDHLEKMDALISGILRYSSIDKDATDDKLLDLNELVPSIVKLIPLPQNVSVRVNQLPQIVADTFKIQQLFQNIICNASASIDKPIGLIEIDVKEEEEYWKFSVSDNGKGIKEVYFDKIFKAFQKLENNSMSTGIGLSIVKKIVSFYGGKIWLESELGKGTTFYFTLKKQQ